MPGVRLRCSLTNDPEEKSPSSPLWFEQEKDKKSSFVFSSGSTTHSIDKPAHVLVHCCDDAQTHPFLLGGLEIVSNSRNVEAYTSDEEGKETYVLTARGSRHEESSPNEDNTEELYTSVIVCPGGPQAVTRLHLKLLSLRPAKCTRATLHSIKIKGRLPDVQTAPDASATTTTASTSQSTPAHASNTPAGIQQQSQHSGLSQSDLAAAMAAVSGLVRTTEDRITQNVQQMESTVGQCLLSVQKTMINMNNTIESQRKDMEKQTLLLNEQQRTIESQSNVLTEMQQTQIELMSLIGSLREEVQRIKVDPIGVDQNTPSEEVVDDENQMNDNEVSKNHDTTDNSNDGGSKASDMKEINDTADIDNDSTGNETKNIQEEEQKTISKDSDNEIENENHPSNEALMVGESICQANSDDVLDSTDQIDKEGESASNVEEQKNQESDRVSVPDVAADESELDEDTDEPTKEEGPAIVEEFDLLDLGK